LTDHSIGGSGMMFGTAQFRNGQMVYVGGLIAPSNFDVLKAAFDQRYGSPCLTDPSQSRMLKYGHTVYWCFADGALEMQQIATGGMSSFHFYALSYDDIVGDLKPKIDF
jgi:hypothetical protein